MSATSQQARLAMAILAIVVGAFLLTVAPVLVQISLDAVLVELAKVAKDKPQYGSGIALFVCSIRFGARSVSSPASR